MMKRQLALLFVMMTVLTLAFASGAGRAQAQRIQQEWSWTNWLGSDEGGETGKTEATPGAQPWMVALVDSETRDAYNGQFCGASLIAPDWVLTAAHCLEGYSANEVDAVIGRHQLSSNDGERIAAEAIYAHAGYSDIDHDIALIKLSRPATAGTPIAPIAAATDHLDEAGTMARVTGWGILTEYGEDSPDKLHGVDIPIVSDAACLTAYPDDGVDIKEICAGEEEGGADSCSGDSGGPLIVPDGRGGFLQSGVVSWGDGCGLPGRYGVYTRLSEYGPWFNDVMTGQIAPTPANELASDDDGFFGDDEFGSADVSDIDLPQSLPFGLTLVDGWSDSNETVGYYDSANAEVEVYAYPDGYTDLDEYLYYADFEPAADERVTVAGQTVLIEDFGDYLGATLVIDGQLVFVDGDVSVSQMRTIVSKLINN